MKLNIINPFQIMKARKKAKIFKVADTLCKANNTVTTLEIKNELRRQYPDKKWYQSDISEVMDEFYTDGVFTYHDNGSYRTYSLLIQNPNQQADQSHVAQQLPKTAPQTKQTSIIKRISKTKAIEVIQNTKGRFFTVTFVKKDGSTRVMNAQYVTGMTVSALGYINVKDVAQSRIQEKDVVKSVNLQTIEEINAGGITYKIS